MTMFHTQSIPISRLTSIQLDNARNEARRNVGALDSEQLSHHLISSVNGNAALPIDRRYDAIDRYALAYVAAARLRRYTVSGTPIVGGSE